MTLVFPNIRDRHTNQVNLFFRDKPGVAGYRLRAANSLDEAYGAFNGVPAPLGGTVAMFDVPAGQTYWSRTIRKRGLGVMDESTRGQTVAFYDPDDFFVAGSGNALPTDGQLAFLRTQVATKASGGFPLGFPGGAFPGTTTDLNMGPILVLQTPDFASVPRPAISFTATAPDVGAVAGNQAPANSLAFRVPFYGDSMVLKNLDAAAPLFFSPGVGIPMMEVPPLENITHTSGMKDQFVIAASGANPRFSMLIATVQGQR